MDERLSSVDEHHNSVDRPVAFASEHIDGLIRKFTVLECERLQTLPDNYTNVAGVSENARHNAIGNGWTVDVIAHILKGIIPENAIFINDFNEELV